MFDEKKNSFNCSCKTPWIGEKCEIKIGKKRSIVDDSK